MKALLVAAVALSVALPRLARADDAAAADPAAAEALFKEARTLWDRGSYADACAKFQASYALDPAPGTLLNIAACSERDGKTATAWSQYVEAARVFRRRADERRAAFADTQAAALEPKLAYAVVRAAAPTAGLTLTRDGASLQVATLDAKLPIDPGAHEIVARAPGRADARVTFEARPGETVEVSVPALAEAPDPPAGAPPDEARPSDAARAGALSSSDGGAGDTQRIAAWVVGGTGLASLAVGGLFVGLTADASSSLDDACPGSVCRTRAAKDQLAEANLFANVANGTLIGGAVVLAVGVVVFLTAPEDAPGVATRAPLAPRAVCGPSGCGLGWTF